MSDMSSDDDAEDLALALMLSQLSSVNKQAADFISDMLAEADSVSDSSDENNNDVVSLVDPPKQSSSGSRRLSHSTEFGLASDGALSTASPNAPDDDDLELALKLSLLQPNDFEDQVGELNRRREFHAAVEDGPSSSLRPMSVVEVWMTPSLWSRCELNIWIRLCMIPFRRWI
jgi:hypothetical protein